ncbi:YtzI protein [Neobacillus sp. D3-1R]|uniref:YtzI protein n=1 Tax=Neobacillus sp. D3-1R TaxID=3445778 RepID=UPI003F9FF9A6
MLTIFIIVAVIIVLVVLVLAVGTTSKAYDFKHTIDPNPLEPDTNDEVNLNKQKDS